MGFVERRSSEGRYRARYRDPLGRQRSRSFVRKADAQRFLIEMEAEKGRGREGCLDAGGRCRAERGGGGRAAGGPGGPGRLARTGCGSWCGPGLEGRALRGVPGPRRRRWWRRPPLARNQSACTLGSAASRKKRNTAPTTQTTASSIQAVKPPTIISKPFGGPPPTKPLTLSRVQVIGLGNQASTTTTATLTRRDSADPAVAVEGLLEGLGLPGLVGGGVEGRGTGCLAQVLDEP